MFLKNLFYFKELVSFSTEVTNYELGYAFCTIAIMITTLTICFIILVNLVMGTCLKMDAASSNVALKIVL